jgi:hypothetical protein
MGKLRVEGRDPSIEFGPLPASAGHEQNHPPGQPRRLVRPSAPAKNPSSFRVPCGAKPALQQDGAQLIDQSRSLADQPVSRRWSVCMSN